MKDLLHSVGKSAKDFSSKTSPVLAVTFEVHGVSLQTGQSYFFNRGASSRTSGENALAARKLEGHSTG